MKNIASHLEIKKKVEKLHLLLLLLPLGLPGLFLGPLLLFVIQLAHSRSTRIWNRSHVRFF